MPTVWVRFDESRQYPIWIQPGGLEKFASRLRKITPRTHLCLISHPRILRRYGRRLTASLKAEGFRVDVFSVPEGESSKSLACFEALIGRMLKKRVDRHAVIAALGGGVIGDLAGYVAAAYMRGLPFIQVPTTLLAQVDSAVGGKVAVNHPLGKNMIGAFHQPLAVCTDPEVLGTLSRRQFRAGLAEVIKAAVIADAPFFAWLETHLDRLMDRDPEALAKAVARACEIKARVVGRDEKERGLRAILNYGHTFGHALEAYYGYGRLLHGEAVAIGMVAAARLGRITGVCSARTAERQIRLIQRAGLPVSTGRVRASALVKSMKNDKKVREGGLNFVLTPHIGHARICKNLAPFLIRQALITVVRTG